MRKKFEIFVLDLWASLLSVHQPLLLRVTFMHIFFFPLFVPVYTNTFSSDWFFSAASPFFFLLFRFCFLCFMWAFCSHHIVSCPSSVLDLCPPLLSIQCPFCVLRKRHITTCVNPSPFKTSLCDLGDRLLGLALWCWLEKKKRFLAVNINAGIWIEKKQQQQNNKLLTFPHPIPKLTSSVLSYTPTSNLRHQTAHIFNSFPLFHTLYKLLITSGDLARNNISPSCCPRPKVSPYCLLYYLAS